MGQERGPSQCRGQSLALTPAPRPRLTRSRVPAWSGSSPGATLPISSARARGQVPAARPCSLLLPDWRKSGATLLQAGEYLLIYNILHERRT